MIFYIGAIKYLQQNTPRPSVHCSGRAYEAGISEAAECANAGAVKV